MFFKQVYKVLKLLPKGKVITYGTIAKILGRPKMSRQVGWALHVNPEPGDIIPCHRVVDKQGSLSDGFAFGGIEIQKEMLINDGIEVSKDYIVDLKRYHVTEQEIYYIMQNLAQ